MADALSQDGRAGVLTTPLGKDVLVLSRFHGEEGLGELFEYRIEALSTQQNIDFNAAIGLNLAVKLETADDLERYFNGVLVEARWIGVRDDLDVYTLVLRPWFWLLSHTSDCRIFSSMQVPDIIKQVFTDRGFSDFRSAISGSYPTLEYCVQYRETDMNFVRRLMEEYGIYYFFEHSEDKHVLVLADSKSAHNPVPGLASVTYLPSRLSQRRDKQQFETWSTYRSFQSGRFVLNDYDYEKPSANLLADADQNGGYAHGAMEIYDYPGRYEDQGEGKTLAKVRLDADQARDQRRTGAGSAPSLFPGSKTKLEGHPVDAENIDYLVLRCTHSFIGQSYRTSGGTGQSAYNGAYEMADADRPFRSPLVTPKSVIRGPQTALVVGKQGEEIDVDNEGRILVQFYWDRKKKASRRVRVGQLWAGKYQKTLFIPRIGDEVVVQYLEGDPDRPLVVGSVYNGDNVPPVDLPANKTKSGMNTDSSKGHNGRNVFSFEDKTGEEYVHLGAQKDLVVQVLNNEQRDISVNRTENIGGDDTITVGTSKSGGNFTLNAVKTMTINVGPIGSPLTQILMDTKSITLNVGPSGTPTQIVMNATGITLTAPNITLNGDAIVSATAPLVTINS